MLIAIYNGYPFYYYDDAGYLASGFTFHSSVYKPIGYGFFLYVFSFKYSLWLVIFFQSLFINYTLFRVFKVFFKNNIYYFHLISLISLSLITSLSWFAGLLMPDIFLGLGILILFILLIERNPERENIFLYFLFFLANILHTANPPILFLTLILSFFYFCRDPDFSRYLKRAIKIGIIIIAGVAFTVISNYEYNFAYNQATDAFIMSRLAETGILKDFLAKNCDSSEYELCRFREKDYIADQFLWAKDALINSIGWPQSQPEYRQIQKKIWREPDYVGRFLVNSLQRSGRLIFSFKLDSFDSLGEDLTYENIIVSYFPQEQDKLENSLQHRGELPILLNFYSSVLVSSWSLMLIIYLLLYKRVVNKKEKYFLYLIISATVINAGIMATLSSLSDSRYNTRITWLIPLVAIIFYVSYKLKK